MLAPTTILVQQHYDTMINRFDGFPVQVDDAQPLPAPPQEQKEIAAAGCGRANVDVIVGTHRLLGKDVKFKDLGLLIVDEEQRFGVAHKESHQEA